MAFPHDSAEDDLRAARRKRWWIILAAGVAGVILAASLGPRDQEQEQPTRVLDYQKPIFTSNSTLICPTDLLLDPNLVEDSPFLAVWNRDQKARDAGCLEWRSGIRVFVRPMFPAEPKYKQIVNIGVRPDIIPGDFFTMEDELTNNAPSDPEVVRLNAALAIHFGVSSPDPTAEKRNDNPEPRISDGTLVGRPDSELNEKGLSESTSDVSNSSEGSGSGTADH